MSGASLSPVKILLVDDLEENLLVLDRLLGKADRELLTARSGREALELLLEHQVALALIDVQMPEMDGFELAELMRGASRTADVPIIFVTAGMREQSRIFRGYDAGAVDFLFKPIEPHVLRNKVNVFVGLYRQRQELENTLRLSEELIAVVSHDLRNPLNLITMTAALLKDPSQDKSVHGAAERISRSCARIESMISDLLDLSRARLGGGIPVNRAASDLLVVTQAVTEELRQTAGDRSISISHRGALDGEWDPSRLEQVMSNLIGNALKHGDGKAPVLINLDGEDPLQVVVSVHNEGTIPAAARPNLFEPFTTRRDRHGQGLGLGLYIVKQIALAHRGDVSLSSTEEDGTTFRVILPRR